MGQLNFLPVICSHESPEMPYICGRNDYIITRIEIGKHLSLSAQYNITIESMFMSQRAAAARDFAHSSAARRILAVSIGM